MRPPSKTQPASDAVNATARAGFNADTVDNYDRGRPEFDPQHVRHVLDILLPMQGAAGPVVEVGAGSGKFTRPLWQVLQARFGNDSPVLTCVEPGDMARAIEAARVPVRLLRTTADAMGAIADGEAAAVVCANSFHWFANEPSVRELRRVLRPGGRLGLVFFGGWQEDSFWSTHLSAIVAPFLDGSAPHLQRPVETPKAGGIFAMRWGQILEDSPYFTSLQRETIQGGWDFDATSMVAYVHSLSMVAKQPAAVRDAVAERVRQMLQLPGAHEHIRARAGEPMYHVPMALRFIWTQARG